VLLKSSQISNLLDEVPKVKEKERRSYVCFVLLVKQNKLLYVRINACSYVWVCVALNCISLIILAKPMSFGLKYPAQVHLWTKSHICNIISYTCAGMTQTLNEVNLLYLCTYKKTGEAPYAISWQHFNTLFFNSIFPLTALSTLLNKVASSDVKNKCSQSCT
jgi:hypothetical protein